MGRTLSRRSVRATADLHAVAVAWLVGRVVLVRHRLRFHRRFPIITCHQPERRSSRTWSLRFRIRVHLLSPSLVPPTRLSAKAEKTKGPSPFSGDGPWCIGVAVFWLHHPLNVGIRMPTLIRRRLDTTGRTVRHAVQGEDMRLSAYQKTAKELRGLEIEIEPGRAADAATHRLRLIDVIG